MPPPPGGVVPPPPGGVVPPPPGGVVPPPPGGVVPPPPGGVVPPPPGGVVPPPPGGVVPPPPGGVVPLITPTNLFPSGPIATLIPLSILIKPSVKVPVVIFSAFNAPASIRLIVSFFFNLVPSSTPALISALLTRAVPVTFSIVSLAIRSLVIKKLSLSKF